MKLNNKGLAIITVLGVMLVLLMIGVSFVVSSRLSLKRGKDYIALLKAKQAAQAGIEHAHALIFADTPVNVSINDWYDSKQDAWAGKYENIEVAGDPQCAYSLMIVDEESKVNLNGSAYGNLQEEYGAPLVGVDITKIFTNNKINNEYYSVLPMSAILPEMILFYCDPAYALDYQKIADKITGRSYEWEKYIRQNLYDIARFSLSKVFRHIGTYLSTEEKYEQIALNMIDYFDADLDITYGEQDTKRFGTESIGFISEILPKTSVKANPNDPAKPLYLANTGEFVEIYNPFHQDVEVGDYILDVGAGKTYQLSNIGINTIAKQSSVIITDDTGRFDAEHPNMPGSAKVVKLKDFYIDASANEVILTLNSNVINQIKINNLEEDKSIIRDDPRVIEEIAFPHFSAVTKNITPTPGDNSEFLQSFIGADNSMEELDLCLNINGDYQKVKSLSHLKYIYLGVGSSKYLQLKSQNVTSESLKIMDLFYYFNNEWIDYFDKIDKREMAVYESPDRIAGKININTASAQVLKCLPGANPAAANAIIAYRESNGPFKQPGEIIFALKQISGLTNANVDYIFDRIINCISVRSNNFKVISKGYYQGKYEYVIETVIDRNFEDLDTYDEYDFPKQICEFVVE